MCSERQKSIIIIMQQLSQPTDSYQKALQLEEDSLTILFSSAGSCFRVVVDDANLPSRIDSGFKDVRGSSTTSKTSATTNSVRPEQCCWWKGEWEGRMVGGNSAFT